MPGKLLAAHVIFRLGLAARVGSSDFFEAHFKSHSVSRLQTGLLLCFPRQLNRVNEIFEWSVSVRRTSSRGRPQIGWTGAVLSRFGTVYRCQESRQSTIGRARTAKTAQTSAQVKFCMAMAVRGQKDMAVETGLICFTIHRYPNG